MEPNAGSMEEDEEEESEEERVEGGGGGAKESEPTGEDALKLPSLESLATTMAVQTSPQEVQTSSTPLSLPPTLSPFPPDKRGPLRASPLPSHAISEGLDEAGRRLMSSSKKKSGKPKVLSVHDLMPLHQDVGRNNKQLLEPSTPEFKPTSEWVGIEG